MTAFRMVSSVLAATVKGRLWFECPSCEMVRQIMHGAGTGSLRVGNGDPKWPTLTPSVPVHYNWSDGESVCHSFVTDGQILFLGDCTHALAGQAVELPGFSKEDL